VSSEGTPHPHHLDAQFAGGLAWTAGAKWVTQAVTWISVVIAARLLSPSDFGAVEMAGAVIGVTNVMAEFGIGSAALQMRELGRHSLAQLNTLAFLLSALAFAGCAGVAPLAAAFFHFPKLRILIVISGFTFFSTGVQSVPLGLLQRDMDYRKLSLVEALQAVVQAVVLVCGASAGLGYWSLVAAPMAGKAGAAALSAFWRPVAYAIPRWKEMATPVRFGMEVALSRLAWVAYSQADVVIVGRLLGPTALGTYRLAIDVASAPAEKVGMLIMRVTGPLFSRVQADRALVRRYFLFISDALALSIFPLALGLAMVAPQAIPAVFGAKWKLAVVPVQWLAAYTTLRALSALMGQVLTSLRYTTFMLWVSVFTFVLMPASFYFAAHWGIGAVAATWVILSPLTFLPPTVKLFRSIQCGFREYLAVLAPAVAGSAAMLCAVFVVRRALPAGWPAVWILVGEIAAGGAAYAGILAGFYRPLVLRYVQFFQRLRKGRGEPMLTEA
jgi:PST family polysaccharide transporter